MNDLYVHQLEIENKQLREQLKLCRTAINEIKEELNKTIDAKDKIINEQISEISKLKDRIDKAIEYIKHYGNLYCLKHTQFKKYKQYEELLEILGDKEND